MVTMKNRWNKLPKEEKDRIDHLPYGWMIRNLLKYGNSLVADDAVKKVGKKELLKRMNEELELVDYYDVYIDFVNYYDIDSGDEDVIAYLMKYHETNSEMH